MGWLGWNGSEGDLDEAGDGVLGRHRPVRARGRCGGEMFLSTRLYGFGVLHLLEMFMGSNPRLNSAKSGDPDSSLNCLLP